MAKSLLFSFDDLTDKNRVVRSVKKQFEALGAVVVAVDVPARVKRMAGITYRELSLSFADSQMVTFRVKQTGDIFEVRLNGKTLPIKEQDDQRKALKEIADAMDKGRTAFQRKLQRVRVDVPTKGMHSTVSVVQRQADKIAATKEMIEKYRKDTEELQKKRDQDAAEAGKVESRLLEFNTKADALTAEIEVLKNAQ